MRNLIIRFRLLLIVSLVSSTAFAQEGKEALTRDAIESHKPSDTYSPAMWETIPENDIAWKKRVWRTIDLSDAGNKFLGLTPTHPSIGDILLSGAYNNAQKAYNIYNDGRFATELSKEKIEALKASGITSKDVTALRIKEDWIYLKSKKKIIVRIVAMAPVIKNGEGKGEEVFWLYYPDARQHLEKQQIVAKGAHPETMDEVFEGRFFSSRIEKVSGE